MHLSAWPVVQLGYHDPYQVYKGTRALKLKRINHVPIVFRVPVICVPG